jgi:hypothetical protein
MASSERGACTAPNTPSGSKFWTVQVISSTHMPLHAHALQQQVRHQRARTRQARHVNHAQQQPHSMCQKHAGATQESWIASAADAAASSAPRTTKQAHVGACVGGAGRQAKHARGTVDCHARPTQDRARLSFQTTTATAAHTRAGMQHVCATASGKPPTACATHAVARPAPHLLLTSTRTGVPDHSQYVAMCSGTSPCNNNNTSGRCGRLFRQRRPNSPRNAATAGRAGTQPHETRAASMSWRHAHPTATEWSWLSLRSSPRSARASAGRCPPPPAPRSCG